MTDKQSWYKRMLVVKAEERNQQYPQYKGHWDSESWMPMLVTRNISQHGQFVAFTGDIVLVDTSSFHILSKTETFKKSNVGKTFVTAYLPNNLGGVDTSVDVSCFKEIL